MFIHRQALNTTTSVIGNLSVLEKFLPLWIAMSMAGGIGLGYFVPQFSSAMGSLSVESVSLPIAIGLIWMMYPPLAAINYSRIGTVARNTKVVSTSMILNWLVGPFLMFALAWFLLPDLPLLRDGVILIGLARCIAMVLVWNMLAGGNGEYAALAVALNSCFQIALYSAYAYFLIVILPGWISPGSVGLGAQISPLLVAVDVAIFLGTPLLLGISTRYLLQGRKKEISWYENSFLPRLKPTALIGLLFTLIVMFSLQGKYFVELPLDIIRVAIPLVLYFMLMFVISYLVAYKLGFSYEDTATTAFTASSNNFELAIAVAVVVFGIGSSQAFATAVGPLIEVPIMLLLVYISLWLKDLLFTQGRKRRTTSTAEREA